MIFKDLYLNRLKIIHVIWPANMLSKYAIQK